MAKMKRNKKPRVPEVLWRLFRDRARTMLDTILSLIPPQPRRCYCRCKPAASCLACCVDPTAFLVRPGDSKAYRRLMNHCFVVVADGAPRSEGFSPARSCSQLQIVNETIEMMLTDRSDSSNVLCNGFDKGSSSSPVVELLTSAAWILLLDRVGDGGMFCLLRHTMIFLPNHQNDHMQVTGRSITDLKLQATKKLQNQGSAPFKTGSCKKRKRSDTADNSSPARKLVGLASPFEELHVTGEGCTYSEVSTDKNLKQNSIQGPTKSKRRSRQFRWQRIKKLRESNREEDNNHNFTGRPEPLGVAPSSNENKQYNHHHIQVPIQCRGCLLLQAPRAMTSRTLIDRKPIFYRADHPSSILPRNHILNIFKPDPNGANRLLEEIFGASVRQNIESKTIHYRGFHSCSTDTSCLHRSLIRKLKTLIHRAHLCQHIKILNKHCPEPTADMIMKNSASSVKEMEGSAVVKSTLAPEGTQENGKSVSLDEPLDTCKMYCSKHQVSSFIWAVCRSIVPQELLGTSSNWRVLRRNISIFIGLRRFEKFSLRQCMYKLRTTGFEILSKKTSTTVRGHTLNRALGKDGKQVKAEDADHMMRTRLLECWVYWLFTSLIVPVVQSNFYVTTTEQGKQDIFYYRKSVWEQLTTRATSDLKDQTLLQLNVNAVRGILSTRAFGFSKLRLLPKENGVRVIANLGACSKIPKKGQFQSNKFSGHRITRPSQRVKYDYFRSVNYVLRDLHIVLKGVRSSEPEKLGSSVFDYNDIYRRLSPFLSGLKESGTVPSVYIVVSDVVKAFDTIDQNKLLSVMKNVMQQDVFHLKKTYQVVCTKKSTWVHENILPDNQTVLRWLSLSRSSVPYQLLHSVLVNQESSYHLQNDDIFLRLTEHVKRNILLLGKKFYLQKSGISQGSILSSLLSSFYFGHLERNVIYPFLEKACEPASKTSPATGDVTPLFRTECDEMSSSSPKYLLMRFIDDFLLITTSKKQATNFFTRLHRGFRDYNCYMNNEKSALNFDFDKISGVSSSRSQVGDDGLPFLRWSGLLINCHSLEIQADYTRYLKNHISSTLTVCWHDKLSCQLEQKLRDFMRPKCHPILFDLNINSQPVVRLNIYQIFLLSAMKYHCYVRELSRIRKLPPASYSAIVLRSIRHLHNHIKKLMRRVRIGSSIRPILQLDKEEVEWLGLTAFSRVLKRKESCHKKLVSVLKSNLLAHRISKNAVPSPLKYAADDTRSSILWRIKY